MYKACPYCGRVHPVGYQCPMKPKRIDRRDSEAVKLRNKYAWNRKSEQIREDAENLCEVCRDQGIYTYDNLEVHHIEKLRDRPDLWLEDDNLICLCSEHHKQAEAGKIKKEYLLNLVQKRIKKNSPDMR